MELTVIQKITASIAKSLVEKADALSRLEHRPTQGEIKELFIRNLLKPFLTSQFGIGTGVVVNQAGEQSDQIDVIIYDKRILMPFIEELSLNVYPVESVVATIEVKTQLNSNALVEAIDSAEKIHEYIYCPDSIFGPVKSTYYDLYKYYKPICSLFAFRGNKWKEFLPRKGLNTEELKENENKGNGWFNCHIRNLSYICQANLFSASTIHGKLKLSYSDGNGTEIVRFISTMLDNIRHLANIKYFSFLKHNDLLSIYLRDQPTVREDFEKRGRGPGRKWIPLSQKDERVSEIKVQYSRVKKSSPGKNL